MTIQPGPDDRPNGAQAGGDRSAIPTVTEGLRERKKRLTRQLIADTATGMFLAHGFDAVRVTDVAAACGVSEKTVYNYFPTKEGLILDRFGAMESDIRRIFGPEAEDGSLIDAAVAAIASELEWMFESAARADDQPDALAIRRFAELLQQTPALRAAQWDMMDRMVQVAAQGIADRHGHGAADPEADMAAHAILGLWRIQFRSLARHSASSHTLSTLRDAVLADVRRAADLIDTGLHSVVRFRLGTARRGQ